MFTLFTLSHREHYFSTQIVFSRFSVRRVENNSTDALALRPTCLYQYEGNIFHVENMFDKGTE